MTTLPPLLNRSQHRSRPGLLVSVRDADEARAALDGGADVIDVKEPDRGALGRADAEVIATIVSVVDGRAIVTAALGELMEIHNDSPQLPPGVAMFKIGLAGCGSLADWPDRWRDCVAALRGHDDKTPQPVAVAYADWPVARAPEPRAVLAAAIELRCRVLLVDTWDKACGPLFHHWPAKQLTGFRDSAHAAGVALVLAGSLDGNDIATAARLQPDLVAVRGAACEGGRRGRISTARVSAVQKAISNLLPKISRPGLANG